MIAVSAILPFLGLVVAPETWLDRPLIKETLGLLGISTPSVAVPVFAFCVAIMLIGAGLVNVFMRSSINRFGAKCRKRLAKELADGCATSPYSWHIKNNAAILVRQINIDVLRWGTDFVTRILGSVQTISLVFVAAALVLTVAPVPGFFGIGFALSMAVAVNRYLVKRISWNIKIEKEKTDSSTIAAQQFLHAIKDVKLSLNPPHFVKMYTDAVGVVCDIQAHRNTLRQVTPIMMMLVTQVAMVLVVLTLWLRGDAPHSIAEQIGFVAIIAARLVPALNRLNVEVAGLWDSYPFSKSLVDLTDEFKAGAKAASGGGAEFPVSWGELSFEDVAYRYPEGANNAIYSVNLIIKRGLAYGMVGPSGAGKTTAVDLLLGLLDPTEGCIRIDGLPISAIDKAKWQARLGYVPQRPSIMDDTLRGNVAFGVPRGDVDENLIWECLALAGLGNFVRSLALGLDAPMGDRGVRLSGGQSQRVAIARALYKKPEILVLDEATSALDTMTERVVREAISTLKNRITTVTVAHRLSTIRDCEKIFLVDNGRIVATGDYEQLSRSSPLFRSLAHQAINAAPEITE